MSGRVRAFAGALIHGIRTRGHGSCMSERIALALLSSLTETRRDLQSVGASLADAVELLERLTRLRTEPVDDGVAKRTGAWN
jgi:hypothetical protein